MWTKIAHFIIKKRLFLIIILGLITVFMGIKARESKMSFRFAELIPQTHQEMQYFHQFKNTFGSDANIMVVGFKDSSIYLSENFTKYQSLVKNVESIEGVTNVLALPTVQQLTKNKRKRIFEFVPLFDGELVNQKDLDSNLATFQKLKFYDQQLVNEESGATIMLVSIKPNYVDSTARTGIVKKVQNLSENFKSETGIEPHYAGLPYVRTELSGEIKSELKFFLYASLAITALILFLFFRSLYAVIFPVLVIAVSVVWVTGTLVLFGYKVTALTGLIPPILVVIGIPNCIYLLNKYHQEYAGHRNQMKALSTIIRKIGIVTLITNCTTAIGFFVLISANITTLKEFGLVAGLNVFSTFFISIVLIPSVFSYLPPPTDKELKHLELSLLSTVLNGLETIVTKYRKWVYSVSVIIALISCYGMSKIKANSYMVDDVPQDHHVKMGLQFFEDNFKGVMPLEIVINTGDKRALRDLKLLEKVNTFQNYLSLQPELSNPISLLNFLKASKQAYFNNHPDFYNLPTRRDKIKILSYLRKTSRQQNEKEGSSAATNDILSTFADTTGLLRISVKTADIGSDKIEQLISNRIIPFADSLFETEKRYEDYDIYHQAPYRVTGTTLLFSRGNQYLIQNLKESLFIAIVLIAIIMGALFKNIRIILISLVPNLIPLLMTGALMGYFGITLKPSTALIFSIAFGISVDDSIHFLAKYRQELLANGLKVRKAVIKSIHETGASMIYTSIVLFAGFIIFTASSFLGTVMLGLLTSTTLLMAMITNLIILPSLLLTFQASKKEREEDAQDHSFIDTYNEHQDDDGEYEDATLDTMK